MRPFCIIALSLLFSPSYSETLRIEPTKEYLELSIPSASSGQWWVNTLKNNRSVFHLLKSGEAPSEPVRRPANILILPTENLGEFQIDMEARTLVMDLKGADIIIVFGYQDENHFYYAHISNDSDNRTHHIIMKVEGGKKSRTPIQLEKDPEPKLNGDWQDIRVTRNKDGHVAVFVDDMETPTLTAKDRTWVKGKIGIGSFNDPAMFGAIEITTP